MKFNVCLPYYNNPGMLELHLETWALYPEELRDQFRFVICDDCSQIPAEPVVRSCNIPAEVWLFRTEIDIPWAWPSCKNIMMHEIPDEPALLTDIDHLLELPDAQQLLDLKVCRDTHYLPRRRRKVDGLEYKRHPSTYILQRSLYWKVGGFEERWLGYYGTDFMMRKRITRMSYRELLRNIWLTLYGREIVPDASTTCFGRKGSEYHLHTPEMKRATKGPVQVVMSQPYHRVL
jgi:hypothetical protein